MFTSITIIVLCLLGIINAGYLFWQHYQYNKSQRQMICPINGHCEQVVESKYGRTMGIKNELIGIAYYLTIIVLVLVKPNYIQYTDYITTAIITISGLAAVVSVYLIYLQAYVLRQWCSWCLMAAAINFLIIIVELLAYINL